MIYIFEFLDMFKYILIRLKAPSFSLEELEVLFEGVKEPILCEYIESVTYFNLLQSVPILSLIHI